MTQIKLTINSIAFSSNPQISTPIIQKRLKINEPTKKKGLKSGKSLHLSLLGFKNHFQVIIFATF